MARARRGALSSGLRRAAPLRSAPLRPRTPAAGTGCGHWLRPRRPPGVVVPGRRGGTEDTGAAVLGALVYGGERLGALVYVEKRYWGHWCMGGSGTGGTGLCKERVLGALVYGESWYWEHWCMWEAGTGGTGWGGRVSGVQLCVGRGN